LSCPADDLNLSCSFLELLPPNEKNPPPLFFSSFTSFFGASSLTFANPLDVGVDDPLRSVPL
jgi:hypothetical protein